MMWTQEAVYYCYMYQICTMPLLLAVSSPVRLIYEGMLIGIMFIKRSVIYMAVVYFNTLCHKPMML